MAILDIDGMLNGKRLRKCSAAARWAFPYYLLLSNGYSRIELDYEAIADHFVSFRGSAPGPEDVKVVFEEYEASHLIFVYESNGRRWAQWDTPNSGSKEWKTVVDLKSPMPPENQYAAWLQEQHGDQWKKFHWYNPAHKTKGLKQSPEWALPRLAQDLTKSPPSLDQGSALGIGLVPVLGLGVGLNTKPPVVPLESQNQKAPLGPAAPDEIEPIQIDATMAGRCLVETMGLSGWTARTAIDVCKAVKQRKSEMSYEEIPGFIKALWREYDGLVKPAKVSLKTFLGTIGEFIESDTWKVPARASPALDEHGGHYEGTVYVTAAGQRMPGYRPPPKAKQEQRH